MSSIIPNIEYRRLHYQEQADAKRYFPNPQKKPRPLQSYDTPSRSRKEKKKRHRFMSPSYEYRVCSVSSYTLRQNAEPKEKTRKVDVIARKTCQSSVAYVEDP
jgi:hypothetical protein